MPTNQFDPDAYLQQKGINLKSNTTSNVAPASEFDPDAYLAQKEIGDTSTSAGGAFLSGVSEGTTFGFGPRISGLYQGVENLFTGEKPSFGEAYEYGKDIATAYKKTAQEEHPIAYGAGELSGSLAVPLPAFLTGAKAAKQTATLGQATKQAISTGLKVGAPTGALSAAGHTENIEDMPIEALKGAAIGGGLGAGLGIAGVGVGVAARKGKEVIQSHLLPSKPGEEINEYLATVRGDDIPSFRERNLQILEQDGILQGTHTAVGLGKKAEAAIRDAEGYIAPILKDAPIDSKSFNFRNTLQRIQERTTNDDKQRYAKLLEEYTDKIRNSRDLLEVNQLKRNLHNELRDFYSRSDLKSDEATMKALKASIAEDLREGIENNVARLGERGILPSGSDKALREINQKQGANLWLRNTLAGEQGKKFLNTGDIFTSGVGAGTAIYNPALAAGVIGTKLAYKTTPVKTALMSGLKKIEDISLLPKQKPWQESIVSREQPPEIMPKIFKQLEAPKNDYAIPGQTIEMPPKGFESDIVKGKIVDPYQKEDYLFNLLFNEFRKKDPKATKEQINNAVNQKMARIKGSNK